MAFPDSVREAFALGLVAVAVLALSALMGLASWALYRIEREETGREVNTGPGPVDR